MTLVAQYLSRYSYVSYLWEFFLCCHANRTRGKSWFSSWSNQSEGWKTRRSTTSQEEWWRRRKTWCKPHTRTTRRVCVRVTKKWWADCPSPSLSLFPTWLILRSWREKRERRANQCHEWGKSSVVDINERANGIESQSRLRRAHLHGINFDWILEESIYPVLVDRGLFIWEWLIPRKLFNNLTFVCLRCQYIQACEAIKQFKGACSLRRWG